MKSENAKKFLSNMSVFIVIVMSFYTTGKVLGIAEGGEIEAKSFYFAPRLAKTNLYEINLIKKRI